MSGEELITQFEEGTTPAGAFHHADHIRLAFEYLARFPTSECLQRFSAALKSFATTHGKPQLYHETITWAYLLLIRERTARVRPPPGLGGVCREQSGSACLEGWGVCNRFIVPETLDSDLARRVFVLPDQIAARR